MELAPEPGSVEQAATAEPYVAVRETHTGVVVLAGDRAFKAKKPVRTDFLDFRTVQQREAVCVREVELNRRLAPDSYLGVAHLSDPSGAPAEPIIVMRRYHDSDRLASMVQHGRPVEHILDGIAEVLARFHDQARRSRLISAQGKPSAIAQRWHDNFSALHGHVGAAVSAESLARIESLTAEYLAGRACLFTSRIEERRIVDGHGDLLADDIFWVDGRPALLDCLEFSDQLRYVDCLDDAAFLAMDLEFLGRKDLGEHFLDRYAHHCDETAPRSLRDFYIAYRAVVRAKVDCVRLAQGKDEAAVAADRHLAIAVHHLENAAVRLVLVGGGPGTGKSTLAGGLAERVGAHVVSTDDVRRELRKSGAIRGAPGILNAGLYQADNVAAVYETMLHRARLLLGTGHSVILDGTWRDPQFRAQAHSLATEMHAALVEISCETPVEVAADRIKSRPRGNSDATPPIAAALAGQVLEWDTAHRIDTSQPLDRSVREAEKLWGAAILLPDDAGGAGAQLISGHLLRA